MVSQDTGRVADEAVAATLPKNSPPRPTRSKILLKLVLTLMSALVTIFVISLVTFAAMNFRSGEEIARGALGVDASQIQVQEFVVANRLDEPLAQRYVHWLGDAVQGDFGTSVLTQRPVSDEVFPRLTRTIALTLVTLFVAAPLSVQLGVFLAWRPKSLIDRSSLVLSVILSAIPEFVIGIVILLLFGVQLRWFPLNAVAEFQFGTFAGQFKAYIMPVTVLVLAVVPYMMRMARAATSDVMVAPYVRAATLRGLSYRTVVWDHAVRNASGPIIGAVSLVLVSLLSGVVVVENVFGFPGVGQLLVEAINSGDTITVQAIIVLLGALVVAINVLTDLGTLYMNPRLRAGRR
jgi:peptide/nickel transport system permease protein